MSTAAFPTWLFAMAAAAIALIAFGLAQLGEGFGMAFVVVTTTLWAVYAARRSSGRSSNG